jgi:hypothetical protein
VVQGEQNADTYRVNKITGFPTTTIQEKMTKVVFNEKGYTKIVDVEPHKRKMPTLNSAQMTDLFEILKELEEWFGYVVDVEFAVKGEKIYLLQIRPVPGFKVPVSKKEEIDKWLNLKDHGFTLGGQWPFLKPFYNWVGMNWLGQALMPTLIESVLFVGGGSLLTAWLFNVQFVLVFLAAWQLLHGRAAIGTGKILITSGTILALWLNPFDGLYALLFNITVPHLVVNSFESRDDVNIIFRNLESVPLNRRIETIDGRMSVVHKIISESQTGGKTTEAFVNAVPRTPRLGVADWRKILTNFVFHGLKRSPAVDRGALTIVVLDEDLSERMGVVMGILSPENILYVGSDVIEGNSVMLTRIDAILKTSGYDYGPHCHVWMSDRLNVNPDGLREDSMLTRADYFFIDILNKMLGGLTLVYRDIVQINLAAAVLARRHA